MTRSQPTRIHSDTRPEAELVLLSLLRLKTPAEKLSLVDQLNASVRKLALCGLRQRHPNLSDTQLQRLLADLLLGQELAQKVYGPMPK
jgi:hypothetical protein